MVKIWPWGGNKEDKEGDMGRMVGVENAAPPQPGTIDQGQIDAFTDKSVMMLDPALTLFIAGPVATTGEMQGPLSHLYPAFTHLNRLTKIKAGRQSELMELQFDYLIKRSRMGISERENDAKLGGALESLRFTGLMMINDNIEGFKAKIVTEQTKHVGVVVAKEKRGIR